MGSKKVIFISVALIVLLGLIVYARALGGQFIWDDETIVRDNFHIRSWSSLPKIFTEDLGAGANRRYGFYRPIQLFTYLVDYSFWNVNPVGYHITNILLHILVALGIYWLVNILFADRMIAFITGIFFVSHPVHVEAVSYISGRSDILAGIFIILALITYIKFHKSRRAVFLLASLVSYLLAILSRETSVILPVFLVLYHYVFKEKAAARAFIPMLAITALYGYARLVLFRDLLPTDIHPAPFLQRLPGTFAALFNYVRLLILPFGLHMEYGAVPFPVIDPRVIAGIIFFILSMACLVLMRRDKIVSFSISWFFIALFPVLNIYPTNAYMAEHWLYLPSVGAFLLLAYGMRTLYGRPQFRMAVGAAMVSLLGFYSVLTVMQCGYWRNAVTFYETTLKYTPYSWRMLDNLGNIYNIRGEYDKAISVLERSAKLDPNHVEVYINIGNSYAAVGRRDEAVAAYKRAIEIDPRFAKSYYNLGVIYKDLGRLEEAIEMYKKTVELNPNFSAAYNNIGVSYMFMGRFDDAIGVYRKALEIDPNDGLAYMNLSLAYYNKGETDKAIEYCDRALALGYKADPRILQLFEQYRKR